MTATNYHNETATKRIRIMMPSILQPPADAKRVTALTITGAPYKSTDNTGRACFAVDGVYTIENGETSKTRVTTTRKKDLAARIARKQASATNGEITIEGGFEVQRFSIG